MKFQNIDSIQEIIHTVNLTNFGADLNHNNVEKVVGKRFLQVINKSLGKSSFLNNWITSTIIPVGKIPNTVKCEEYRPINMILVYEKL